jgi:hypothetical protein
VATAFHKILWRGVAGRWTMKPFNDATSPFGRKIVVACLERSIPLQEEFVDIYAAGPIDRLNPLRQIPTLARRKSSKPTHRAYAPQASLLTAWFIPDS